MKYNFREYTPIPNLLIEEVIKSDLRGSSIKIMFVIMNATIRWGDGQYRKHKFPVAYTRITNETGFTRKTVSEAIKELEEKEFIEIERVFKKTSVIGIHSRLFNGTGLIEDFTDEQKLTLSENALNDEQDTKLLEAIEKAEDLDEDNFDDI